MSKRTATSELNDRNWDQEEEKEDPGQFKKASDDALKQRPIIKAKRRGGAEGGSTSFGGFTGFSFKPTTTSTPFSLNVKSVTNGQSQNGSNGDLKNANKNAEGSQQSNESKKENSSYLQNLKNLNESVLQWIKSHVEKNPYCILTPIFKDYEKHLSDLDKEKQSTESSKSSTISFGFGTDTASTSNEKPTADFKFGISTAIATATSTAPSILSSFNFKTDSTATTATSGFSFAVGKPGESVGAGNMEEGDEEYVPPKPEVKEVVEEGSAHTAKCKLFYQKDGNWTERGVGHLHLKQIEDEAQLIVRADTNLGNILLNIMLTSSLPLKRQGKNNISLMCIPNPPINPKDDSKSPVPMLIRVKTAEDADQLLEKMNELRNKS